MSLLSDLLSQSGETLLGVIIGGAIAVLGLVISARAIRQSATESANASRDVAEISKKTALLELRLKQSELIFEKQLAASREFLSMLDNWDFAIRDINKLGHDESKIPHEYFDGNVGMQRHKTETLLRDMRLVLPQSVTSAASSAIDSGLSAIEAHETNFYTSREDDKERRHITENVRVKAIEKFQNKRDAYLSEFQSYIHADDLN